MPQLEALARAAETGESCPRIRLIPSGCAVTGRPGRTADFLERNEDRVAKELFESQSQAWAATGGCATRSE